MYIYTYVYIYIYICMYIHIYIYVYMHIYESEFVHESTCIFGTKHESTMHAGRLIHQVSPNKTPKKSTTRGTALAGFRPVSKNICVSERETTRARERARESGRERT